MRSDKKPIRITLYHASWCGHCVNFMPAWEKMKMDKNACKNIAFEQHEESTIGSLDDSLRTVGGTDVRSFGYPSIRISVNNKDYIYEGPRTVDNIYRSIINSLQEGTHDTHDTDNPVVVTKSEAGVDISTDSEDVNRALSEMGESDFMKGGNMRGGASQSSDVKPVMNLIRR